MRGNFENSCRLVRFTLKRETIISTIWISVLVLFCAALVPAMGGMFDADGRRQFAASFDNPVMIAMMGPVFGAENYTQGAMYSNMMLLWTIIAAGIMNIFLVVRHTRADEEKGRREVVLSLPVGRLSTLNATMLTAVIVNVTLGLLTGIGLAAMGAESMGLAGSMLFGAIICASGLVFAAITALFCQLSASRGGAMGYSFLMLGILYMLRAAGDINAESLSLLSPLGLAQRSQVYVGNYLWPVPVLLLESAVIAAVAYKLNSIRDLDQGFLPARQGRREASPLLKSPIGLAFRLLRNTMIVWFIVMFALGASYGSVIGEINRFVGDSPQYLKVLGMPDVYAFGLADGFMEEIVQTYFMSFVTTMMTLMTIIPLLIAVLKTRNEEKEGRAEIILSHAVPRVKYMAGYTLAAYALSVLLPCATAVGVYLSAESLGGGANPFALDRLLGANLAYLPALWLMIGIAALLIGLIPKASGAIWGYFGFVCFASFIGDIIGLPEWLLGLAPLKHVSQVLLVDVNYTPLVVMTAVAACLTVTGFVLYRRRDTVA